MEETKPKWAPILLQKVIVYFARGFVIVEDSEQDGMVMLNRNSLIVAMLDKNGRVEEGHLDSYKAVYEKLNLEKIKEARNAGKKMP